MAADVHRLDIPAERRRAIVAAREAEIATEIMAALKADRQRAAELVVVASQASRLGVTFSAAAAIKDGMSVEGARELVMDAASHSRKG